MPNKHHLERIRGGVAAWNEWRRDHPEITPDLDTANLVRAELAGANLAGASLKRTNFTRARLTGADLRGADLEEARVLEADLTGADLSEANLNQAQLTGSKLIQAKLTKADLRRAQAGVINLREADLRDANLAGADLRESLLPAADLRGADMSACLLLGTHLEGTNLAGVLGLTPEAVAGAHTNGQTVLPDERHRAPHRERLARSSYDLLLDLRRSLPKEGDVYENQALQFNAAITKLEELGHDLSELKLPEGSFSRRVASWESTPGGEAFEMDPSRRVEGSLFRSLLDRAIDSFEIVRDGDDKGSVAFKKK
jgi:Pentapeptide repeats (8 copies)